MKILILDSITLGDDISLDKLKELGEVITYPQSILFRYKNPENNVPNSGLQNTIRKSLLPIKL